jgi:hypothetical protein
MYPRYFGERVLEIVEHCSNGATSRGKSEWRTRNEAYIARLRGSTDTAALLASYADKIAQRVLNPGGLPRDWRRGVWAHFTSGKEITSAM